MFLLKEDSRNTLVARSKRAKKEKDGKTRYEKRLKSSFSSNVAQYNKLDMNTLFKKDILNINIDIKGETNNYIVSISFGGFLQELRKQLEKNNDKLDLRIVIRALVNCFNRENVYVRCSCEDFFYRMGYWASKNKIITGPDQTIPSKETNPNDDLGPGCKHLMLVLSNTNWLIKVASVIRNYISYMEKHNQNQYAKLIYPAIYGKAYEKPSQTSMFDSDELDTEKDIIDRSNKYARSKSQFKKDNPYRIQKQEKPIPGQLVIKDEE